MIFRHPFDRSNLRGKRVGEQTLEGTNCAPSARLCCLHDTRLEPTHHGVSCVPVDSMPVYLMVGDRTSRCCPCCHLLCLLDRLATLSRDVRLAWEVSSLSRGVMLRALNPYPPHYRVAFACSRVPYPHLHRLALRLAFPCGKDTGLPRSTRIPVDDLGSACPPVEHHLREVNKKPLHLSTYLLVQALQPLWLVESDDVYRRFISISRIIPP